MQLPHDNLSENKRQAIEQLNKREDIIIAQADNGGTVAILDTNNYLKEAKRQLNNTKFNQKLSHNPIQQNTKKLKPQLAILKFAI